MAFRRPLKSVQEHDESSIAMYTEYPLLSDLIAFDQNNVWLMKYSQKRGIGTSLMLFKLSSSLDILSFAVQRRPN